VVKIRLRSSRATLHRGGLFVVAVGGLDELLGVVGLLEPLGRVVGLLEQHAVPLGAGRGLGDEAEEDVAGVDVGVAEAPRLQLGAHGSAAATRGARPPCTVHTVPPLIA
jgi:hypothetical protein